MNKRERVKHWCKKNAGFLIGTVVITAIGGVAYVVFKKQVPIKSLTTTSAEAVVNPTMLELTNAAGAEIWPDDGLVIINTTTLSNLGELGKELIEKTTHYTNDTTVGLVIEKAVESN